MLLSCSGDKLLKMWSVTDGTCLRTLEGHTGGVLRCSFLTAGTQVLSAGADGLLKLWDARTGANLATFEGHEDRLWGLAASAGPAESLLASGAAGAALLCAVRCVVLALKHSGGTKHRINTGAAAAAAAVRARRWW